jgi:hypothetical protein
MPAKDLYHNVIINALVVDGWIITDDPLLISYGSRNLYVDLGAERSPIAAEKNGQKIAVEIKSFLGQSIVKDLELAIGQYHVYLSLLAKTEADRILYLAVPIQIYEELFLEKFGQLMIESLKLRLIVFDTKTERILEWIN